MTNPAFQNKRGGAVISPCGIYRYRLWRELGPTNRDVRIVFIMLNPSTADATTDDPTIRKCSTYARRWGYARLDVVNLFAYRATKPKELLVAAARGEDVVGLYNDQHILEAAVGAAVVCAWGNHGGLRGRDTHVCRLLNRHLNALVINRTGQPAHPLYLAGNKTPILYQAWPAP